MQYIHKTYTKNYYGKKNATINWHPNKSNLAKTDKDYSSFDGGGIYLLIRANNFEIWCFKYTHPYTKKEALLSFGSYFDISLQQARNLLNEAQGLIRQSIDIQEYKAE